MLALLVVAVELSGVVFGAGLWIAASPTDHAGSMGSLSPGTSLIAHPAAGRTHTAATPGLAIHAPLASTFSLSPGNGTIGSTTAATGSGFVPDSTVTFAFAGTGVPSNCAADSSGNVPGLTGTPCSFTVPAAPAGPETVGALGWTLPAGINVSSNPSALAYDSGMGEVFVANEGTNNVSVISDSTNTVVASVAVGNEPDSIAYDSAKGELFVSNYQDDNVSVISDATNTIVTNISVGIHPISVVYDSGMGEVFVAELGDGNVSVINDTTNTVVATVLVGGGPLAVAYDSGMGEVFVANYYNNTVNVISDASNTVVATIAVGDGPYGAAYDAAKGEVFIPNYYNNTVNVISDASNTVVATVAVGDAPDAVAYDSGTGEVFVANENDYTVSAINDTSNLAVGTVPVGGPYAYPDAVAYDSGQGELFVANQYNNNVSIVIPLNQGTPLATTSFYVNSSFSLTRTSGAAGMLLAANGTGFAASSPISFSFDGSAVTSTCAADAVGTFPGTTGTACVFTVPPAATGGLNEVTASDGTNSGSASYFVTEPMTLSEMSGGAGSLITANGTGPGANANLLFTIGGGTYASSCAADSTGSFPGTTGTPCTFSVPALPHGAQAVVASGWPTTAESILNLAVGGDNPYPVAVAYDSGKGEVFVANTNTFTVSVINDTNDSVVATIATQGWPDALTYDWAKGEIFVACEYSDSVDVIDDSNNSVVATIPVGDSDSSPEGIVYDSGHGEVFVANSGDNNVSVINDTNDSVVTSIAVGDSFASPDALAYDSGRGEVWVANEYDNNVSVINDTNDSVVTSIGVGDSPVSLVYDSGMGEVFVANAFSRNVSVISDTTDTVVNGIATGRQPYALAYDPLAGEIFLGFNRFAGSMSVISDVTDSILATVATGAGPQGIAYDSGAGAVYVADNYDNTVSVVYPQIYGTSTFTVSLDLALNTSTGTADVGQTVTIQGSGYGGSLPLTVFTLGAFSLSCMNATVGTCTSGSLTTASNGSFVALVVVPTVLTSGPYTLTVNDSLGNSVSEAVTVYTDPSAGSISVTTPSADVGQSTTFSTNASFGSGLYTYAWSGLPAGCSGSSASIVCVPTAPGNLSISVQVTDSNGFVANSSSLHFLVFADPVAAPANGSLLSGQADADQSVTFTTVATLGTGTYVSYQWQGLPSGCSGTTASVTCSGTDLPAGQYSISVTVTDSNGATSAASAPLAFLVDGALAVATPSASHPSLDLGQTVTFSGSAAYGSGDYTYAWTGLPTGCAGGATYSISCTPTASGTFSVQLRATDTNGGAATSAPLSFSVYADPTASLAANRSAFDVGEAATLTATGALGSGGFTYLWTGLPTGCAGTTSAISCSPTAAGTFTVVAKVTDSNGLSATTASVQLVVAAPLTARIALSSVTPTSGQSVQFTVNATGGTGALTYSWSFGDGTTGAGASVSHTFSAAGSYAVSVRVNDSTGGAVEQTLKVTVLSSSQPVTPASGSSSDWALWAAVGVVLIVVVIAALLIARRQKWLPGSSTKTPAKKGSENDSTDASSDGPAEPSDAPTGGGSGSS
ncbi:MAG: PKD domain-containing protein [Thermoplasmata archaeon]|nr:PKD domain-containing protein [Thermoplasmata archaeon]